MSTPRRTAVLSLVAVVAALAVSGLSTVAAQATEGPFYKVAGTRLLSGASKNIVNAKATKNFVLKGKLGGFTVTITCKALTVSGGKIIGSTGANSASGEGTFEYKECTQTGNGSPCSVVEPIKTTLTASELGYATSARSGKILVLFLAPLNSKNEREFVNIKFTGTGCITKEAKVTGSVIGEAWSGGKAIEVGKEPAEAKLGELNFPATQIKEMWVEKAGTVEKMTAGLVFGFEPATLEGTSSFELEGSPLWGVYTK